MSYSETRWWSKWEVFEQLMVQFAFVRRFLKEAEAATLGPKLVPQIQEMLADEQSRISLQLELAAIVDI